MTEEAYSNMRKKPEKTLHRVKSDFLWGEERGWGQAGTGVLSASVPFIVLNMCMYRFHIVFRLAVLETLMLSLLFVNPPLLPVALR